MKCAIKVYFVLFLLSLVSLAKAEDQQIKWGVGYAAIAAHYFPQKYNQFMPNKVDSDGYLVRLPHYLTISREWTNSSASHLIQVGYFENCYLDPSFSFTYAKVLEEFSSFVEVRGGGVLYIRKLPRDDSGALVQDFWGEVRSGDFGIWLMPAIIFTLPVGEHWRFDLGVSGVAIGQIRFVF